MRLSRPNFQRYFPVHIERRFITQSEEQSPPDSNNTSLMNILSYFLHSPQTNRLFKQNSYIKIKYNKQYSYITDTEWNFLLLTTLVQVLAAFI